MPKLIHSLPRGYVKIQAIAILLTTVLAFTPVAQALGADDDIQKIHAEVTHLGVGHKAKLTLKVGGAEKGTIQAIDDASFSLDRGPKGGVTTVSYDSVKEIHRDGLSKGAKIGIVVAVVAVAAVAITVAVLAHHIFNGKQTVCNNCTF
jgi:hypothetical protein